MVIQNDQLEGLVQLNKNTCQIGLQYTVQTHVNYFSKDNIMLKSTYKAVINFSLFLNQK